MSVLDGLLQPMRSIRNYLGLPPAAKKEFRNDLWGLSDHDPGIDRAISESLAWLARAQDNSLSRDGGVARHYSLVSGWSSSYPETTGYIIPTMLRAARVTGDDSLRQRAKRMLDWLVGVQLEEGGFPGGLIDSRPVVAVTFNTGQILLGLAAGVAEFGDQYRQPLRRAADWLVATQDHDGCWRSQPTPFARPGEKSYETHVAWGLLEAARVEPSKAYEEAALANIRWCLTKQHDNGWFESCCLSIPDAPLTHTLGYVTRGILEAYLYTKDENLLKACLKTANGLAGAIDMSSGFLSGRLNADWQGVVPWACLTGTTQIAYCWLKLYECVGHRPYRDAAYAANRYVRRTLKTEGPPQTRGAVKGSFPVYAGFNDHLYRGYGPYEYLNWAAKFHIDSNMLEKKVREAEDGR